MYAVVATGGKQYRVEAGSELIVERLAVEPGASVTFDRVLLVGDGEAVTIGTPTVDGARVNATVLGEELGPKLIVFKFKQKVKYRRTTGHRQHLMRVRIDEITTAGRRERAEKPAADAEQPSPEAVSAAPDAPVRKPRARRAAAPALEPTEASESTAEASGSTSEARESAAEPQGKPAIRRRAPSRKAEAKE